MKTTTAFAVALLVSPALMGCAHVAVEGGDKPITIDVNVNLRVAHELDSFFAFEDKGSASSTSQPATAASAPPAVVKH